MELRDEERYICEMDDILILSTDGLYRVYTQEHVVKRVLALRKAGYNLA